MGNKAAAWRLLLVIDVHRLALARPLAEQQHPRGNLACASVFLVEPTGLHHAGDDLAIVFVFLIVCTKPSAGWSS